MAYISQFEVDQQRQAKMDQGLGMALQGFQGMEENRRRALDEKKKMELAAKQAEKDAELHSYQKEKLDYEASQRALPVEDQDAVKKESAIQRLKRTDDLKSFEEQERIRAKYRQPTAAKMDPIELHKQKLEVTNKFEQDKAANSKKPLSANDVLKINEGAMVPKMLEDVAATIESNQELFSPVMGKVRSWNPYDEKSQTAQSQIKASSQAFGKFMEGGVLRKEDEIKYAKMFPELGDTPEVAKNKLQNVQRLLINKLQGDVTALHKSGYDVSGINANFHAPEVPTIIQGQGKAPVQPNQITHEDNAAIQWAKANANDPRAKQILQLHGAN